jgi:hypothetical protein
MWFPGTDEMMAANVLDIVVTRNERPDDGPRPESLNDRRLKADLRSEAAQTNRSVPVRIDSLTTLDRAEADGFTLTNFYTLKTDGIDVRGSRPHIAASVREEVCADQAVAAAVRDGARIVFSYRDAAKRHLFDVAVTRCL